MKDERDLGQKIPDQGDVSDIDDQNADADDELDEDEDDGDKEEV